MKLKEVQDSYFDYQEKHFQYVREVQQFFISKVKISPYVWLDNVHQLHVKFKFRRDLDEDELYDTIFDILYLSEIFEKDQNLERVWVQEVTDTDPGLPFDRQKQTTLEIMYKVLK